MNKQQWLPLARAIVDYVHPVQVLNVAITHALDDTEPPTIGLGQMSAPRTARPPSPGRVSKHDDAFAVLGQMDAAHPDYPHWYLPWFAVDTALQDRGLGSQLMKPCLQIVDASHLPAYLETPSPRNISFYQRHGFEVTGDAQAGTCPPVTLTLRAAR